MYVSFLNFENKIVLSGEKEEAKRGQGAGHRREDQLAHVAGDLVARMSPATPQVDNVHEIQRQDSTSHSVPAAVNKDTQKFIAFAGWLFFPLVSQLCSVLF